MKIEFLSLAGLVSLVLAPPLAAQGKPNPIEADGTVNVPAFRLPPSVYLSEEAKKSLPRRPFDANDMLTRVIERGRVDETRRQFAKGMEKKIAAMAEQYGVTYRETTVGGVHGYLVTPGAMAPGAKRKILVNLPGGGFIMAYAGAGGLMESIPLASLAGVEILTIDYRQAPEAVFPAASEDVEAVYRELLKTRKPSDIGIFGNSAGGLLTAQAMAWFRAKHLPAPAAAGIFCATADARWAGDSWYASKPHQGLTSPATLDERFYYGDHDLADPLMSPIESDAVMAFFPPTLLLTSMRAGEASSAVNTHRLLVRNGVEADLHIWDGLDHCFFSNLDLPESREALNVAAAFFGKHLGIVPARGRTSK